MKQMRYVLGTLILLLVVVFNLAYTANAYTEEEKQQAKAWLSAHGYSPDMGGANQAYEDYLNGKFDEELGYDTNGDGIPASTTEAASEENKTEAVVKPEQGTSTETVPSDETKPTKGNAANGTVSNDNNTAAPTTEPEQQTEAGKPEKTAKEMPDKEKTDKEKPVRQTSPEQTETKGGNIAWYNPANRGIYQDALVVITLAVLMLIVIGVFVH